MAKSGNLSDYVFGLLIMKRMYNLGGDDTKKLITLSLIQTLSR